MKTICNNNNCTGCSACVNICPKQALSLRQDENGFFKPYLDKDKCIDCNLCENTCPLNGIKSENYTEPKLYVFNNFSSEAKLSATAGGFQIIAKNFIQKKGKVVGAAWGENWRCEHIIVDNLDDLKKLYKSKYLQSYLGDIFKRIKNELNNGTKILFSGLPCQIAGLKSYLKKDYENLFIIDILCNNAPSYGHFKKFLDDNFGIENIKDIDFRYKAPDEETTKKMVLKISLNNGEEFLNEIWTDGSYYQTFVNRMLAGEHCENCHFAKFPRLGDITLGDIFGAERIDSRFVGLKSESVLVNSKKGEELFKIINDNVDEIIEIPIDILKSMHPALEKKWEVNPQRDRLFDLLKKYPFQKACEYILENKYDIGVVGVPTNPNFGGGLTYLALKWTLEDLGKTVLMISPPEIAGGKAWLPNNITNFEKNPYHPHELTYFKTKPEMKILNTLCNMFLVGSDQLFSTHFTNYAIYADMQEFSSLDWVLDSKKKSAYSASFGQDEINCPTDMKNRMSYYLRKFDNFSVRERSAVELCKREFGFEPEFVLDPVFICDKNHYKQLYKTDVKKSGLTTYILDFSEEKNKMVNKIKEALNLKVTNLENATGKFDEAMSMEYWLSAIINSDFVITDSFHGTCFAIIFNKPFITISNQARGMSRFALLKEFKLEDRLISSYEEFKSKERDLLKPINWDEINFKVEQLKKHSLEILKKAIEPKRKFPSDYDILNEKIQYLENNLSLLNEKTQYLENNLSLLNKKTQYLENNLSLLNEKTQYLENNLSLANEKKSKIKSLRNWFISKTRSKDGTHRIITFFGIKIKFKRKQK